MNAEAKNRPAPYLSRAGAWAFALGTSVGWGSLVVTTSAYLAQAGPAGSVLGLLAGAVVMLFIARSYAYLMNCHPEAGGAYSFCREAFGYDCGFLSAWFLALTYLAMLWANATSLPLFARIFFGGVFEFGRLYSIFGYDVYLGEALLSIAAILFAAVLCVCSKKVAAGLMIGMVSLFTIGISVCFCGAALGGGISSPPAFVPGTNALGQIVRIAVMSPWAFIGFESVSHGAEEFAFPAKKVRGVMTVSVISAAAVYVFVTLLSVSAYPDGCGSWLDYIRSCGGMEGLEALPPFYAAHRYLGAFGTGILTASLLALIVTSLIGNITALSRLFFALGRDGILPKAAGSLNRRGIPAKGVWLVSAVSLLIPFLGRTAIGWIVDVTTLGATLTYGLVSAAACKEAGFRGDRTELRVGRAGLVLMIGFGLYLLVPNLFSRGSMETESYFLFAVWAALGFFVFRAILKRDGKGRFGRSIVVWIALLSLILFVSLVWMNQSVIVVTDTAAREIGSSYAGSGQADALTELVGRQMAQIRAVSARSVLAVVVIFVLALAVLVNNYRMMSRQAEHSRRELGLIRDMAERDPLTGVRSKLAYGEEEKKINDGIAAGTAESFALAILDVNGLKQVNDTLGHQAGDEYLKKAGRMICMYFTHSPVYRVGGDEFIVLMRDKDYNDREALLGMFRKESESHIAAGDVVISIGSSDYLPGSDKLVRDVFERADAQMYEHKNCLKSMGAAVRS